MPVSKEKKSKKKNRFALDEDTVKIWFRKLSEKGISLFRAILIIGLSFVILYPIILKISIAFKDKIDLYDPTVVFIPRNITLDNFRIVIDTMDYFKTILNSTLLSGGTMLLTTIACALAGYGFARFKFRGSNILFALVILTILVPPQTIMVPTYLNYRDFDFFGIIGLFNGGKGLNLLGSYWPFIISSLTGMGLRAGLFIFIFRQFFKGFPNEIEDAALVDGAGVIQTFFRIMLPNAVPAIITVMLFAFVWQWNDTYYTTMFLDNVDVISTKLQSVGVNIGHRLSSAEASTGVVDPAYVSTLVNTAVLLSMAPLITMYLFVQRHFVESVERTGIVG